MASVRLATKNLAHNALPFFTMWLDVIAKLLKGHQVRNLMRNRLIDNLIRVSFEQNAVVADGEDLF
ncbi:hypothetical protein D3C85_1814750 [compost metagenome]